MLLFFPRICSCNCERWLNFNRSFCKPLNSFFCSNLFLATELIIWIADRPVERICLIKTYFLLSENLVNSGKDRRRILQKFSRTHRQLKFSYWMFALQSLKNVQVLEFKIWRSKTCKRFLCQKGERLKMFDYFELIIKARCDQQLIPATDDCLRHRSS